MKKYSNVLIGALIVVVAGGALAVALMGDNTASTCKGSGAPAHYTITIKDNKVSNTSLKARKCDTMTITNKDSIEREIAFGPHDHHVAYDGIKERELHQGESVTVTLNKMGAYYWHDHLHDEIDGNFAVTE